MAIQNRRGADADFDANKMLPAEIAVTTDGSRKVYVAFAPGDVKELASAEEVQQIVDDFNYSYVDNTGHRKTVKLTEKRIVTYNPKLAEKQKFEIKELLHLTQMHGFTHPQIALNNAKKHLTFVKKPAIILS